MASRGRGSGGVALLAALLPILAGCIDEQPTLRPADVGDIRTMTEGWTGVPLPGRIALIHGSYVADFLDPSLTAIFDAASPDVDRLIGALGSRTIRDFVADCRATTGPATFAEVDGSPRVLDSSPNEASVTDGAGRDLTSYLVGLVGRGTIERCRNVAFVEARPKGAFTDVTVQVGAGGTSRVVLSVVTT